jgi:hypothetical protein
MFNWWVNTYIYIRQAIFFVISTMFSKSFDKVKKRNPVFSLISIVYNRFDFYPTSRTVSNYLF